MILSEITAAIKSIDTIISAAKGFFSLKKEFEINLAKDEIFSNLIEIKQQLLLFQTSYSEILSYQSELQKKIIDFENWETKTFNYSLIEITSGNFVYLSKESQEAGNKQPWFCATCYNEKKLSPFQRKYPNHDAFIYPICKFKFELPDKKPPYHPPRREGGFMGV
jgi:hypothetical protein